MNSYFQLDLRAEGTFLKIYPATEGGEKIDINELADYLKRKSIPYDIAELNRQVRANEVNGGTFQLDTMKRYPERELISVYITDDKMTAVARFYPPSIGGSVLSKEDIISDLNSAKVVNGIDMRVVDSFVGKRVYLQNIEIAHGDAVRHGSDATIDYFFSTDLKARPTLNEDGSVDFFNLNTVNHIKKGDLLARLNPEDPGDPGMDVCGNVVKPRDVKRLKLKYGHNITISEDFTELYSNVNGHVNLYDDKVFVSDVFEVENVDNSTGDITYEGSVKVNGNVNTNFSIKAKGNVEVRGVVEGARIEADGDIIIAKGINGMNKGVLIAGGNIIVKYIENAFVQSGGYVETEAVMHSKVAAGTEINVVSKKGFISGSTVSATKLINVKTLGSSMGADTVVELGVDPLKRARYDELKRRVDSEQKLIAQLQPVCVAFATKLKQGVSLPADQIKNFQDMMGKLNAVKQQLEDDVDEMDRIQDSLSIDTDAKIVVTDVVYSGTKIIISDVSMTVKEDYRYCKFMKVRGDVSMSSL